MDYKCNTSFTDSNGDSFHYGDCIKEYEYNLLSYDEKKFFDKIEEEKKQDNSYKASETESPLNIMSDGHVGLNIGGGLSIDLNDGSLGLNMGGGFSLNI